MWGFQHTDTQILSYLCRSNPSIAVNLSTPGYGFTGRRKTDALWMPFLGAESADGGAQSLRMGVKLTSGPNLEAGLEFGRLENGRGATERAVQLRGALRW